MEGLEALKSICVDTDILVDYLRGREPGKTTFDNWRKKAEIYITSVTMFELLLGAHLSSKRQERVNEVQSLLDQCGLLLFDRDSAEKAAEKGAELRLKGHTIDIRDLLNASICLSRKMPILTKNKAHYERVNGLTISTP
ncbi:MAG: type II toxin-antitoxin system VapC family toxin [Candidatus Bathyarchaeia archaeon]